MTSPFFAATGVFTYNSYLSASIVTPFYYYVGLSFGLLWGGISIYCALAPFKMINTIRALPPPPRKQGLKNPVPELEFELLQVLPFVKPQPLRALPNDVLSNQLISNAVDAINQQRRWNAEQAVQSLSGQAKDDMIKGISAPTPPDSGWFSGLIHDFYKMFARQSNAALRVKGKGNLKLQLKDAFLLSDGNGLDQLIKVDAEPIDWLKAVRK